MSVKTCIYLFLQQEARQQFFFTSDGAVPPRGRPSNLDYLSLDFNSASPSPVQKVRANLIGSVTVGLFEPRGVHGVQSLNLNV